MATSNAKPSRLTSAYAKLSQVRAELAPLEREVRLALNDPGSYGVDVEVDSTTGEKIIRARVAGPPDLSWAIRIGAAAHYLRSALDNVAWQLALLGESASEKTYFPLCESEARWVPKKLSDIPERFHSRIRAVQPFACGGNAQRHPLWLLHRLNIYDKHQAVPVVVARGSVTLFESVATPEFIGFRGRTKRVVMEDGKELFRLRSTAKQGFDLTNALELRFAEDAKELGDLPVWTTMLAIHKEVHAVLESFSDVLV